MDGAANADVDVVLADTHGPILGKAQPAPNLGLLYLASYARERLPGVRFHYLPQRRRREDHFALVDRVKPSVYGISFTSYGAGIAYSLLRELKARRPEMLLVAGGAHASAVPAEVIDRGGADVCVIGEGERTFVALLQHRHELEAALPTIPGIAYRSASGVRTTPPRALIDEIDEIPLPAYDLAQRRDFVGISHRRGRPNIEMIVTRGCPFRCVFCANPVFRVDGPLYRARSPECIAREAELLYRQGYREIYLHSDELNVRHEWSIDVCKALAALGHPDLFFQANLRVAPMSPRLAEWLRRANFWLVRFGIESGSQRVLRGIKKKMAMEQTEHACRLVAGAGVRVFGYFMMFQFWEEDGRLACERPDEVEESLRFARRLWREGVLHYSSWMFAIPVQGSELYDLALRHGMIQAPFVPTDAWDPSPYLPGVTRTEFSALYRRARRLQAMMALRAGGFELRNWRGLASKAMTALRGANANTARNVTPPPIGSAAP